MTDGSGKGDTIVSGERPSLTARRGNACNRCRFAARCVVEDCQERPAVSRVGDVCHVSPGEHERDDHEEAEEGVDVS
jgi:hypothetical protein